MSPKAPKPEPRYLARYGGVTSYRGTRDRPRAIDDLEPIEPSKEEEQAAERRLAEALITSLLFTIEMFDAEIAFGRPTPTEQNPHPPAACQPREFTRIRERWIERCRTRLAATTRGHHTRPASPRKRRRRKTSDIEKARREARRPSPVTTRMLSAAEIAAYERKG